MKFVEVICLYKEPIYINFCVSQTQTYPYDSPLTNFINYIYLQAQKFEMNLVYLNEWLRPVDFDSHVIQALLEITACIFIYF